MNLKWFILLLFVSSGTFAGPVHCHKYLRGFPPSEIATAVFDIQKESDWWTRALYRKYSKLWTEEKRYSARHFDQALDKSYEILFKIRHHQGLISNTERDFHARPEELVRWAETEVLRNGLKSYLYQVPKNQSLPRRIYEKVSRILDAKPVKFLIHLGFWTLPDRANRTIPNDLLAKVIVDGVDAHLAELGRAYNIQGQNKVDTYRRLQNALKHISLAFTAMTSLNVMQSQIESQARNEKVQFEQQMKELDQGLDQIESMLDSGEFDS